MPQKIGSPTTKVGTPILLETLALAEPAARWLLPADPARALRLAAARAKLATAYAYANDLVGDGWATGEFSLADCAKYWR